MTQAEYMLLFADRLGRMPMERKQEILEDILAHFRDGAEQGIPEDKLAEGLGDPEALAREYRATFAAEQAHKKPTVHNVWRVIFAGIGMGMLNLIFAVPIGAAVFAVWVSLLVSGGAMALAGVAAAILSLVDLIVPLSFVVVGYPVGMIFAGISIAALGGLLVIGTVYMGRWLGRVTVRYVKTNVDIIIGRRKEHE